MHAGCQPPRALCQLRFAADVLPPTAQHVCMLKLAGGAQQRLRGVSPVAEIEACWVQWMRW